MNLTKIAIRYLKIICYLFTLMSEKYLSKKYYYYLQYQIKIGFKSCFIKNNFFYFYMNMK